MSPTFADILTARDRLSGHARHTPLLRAPALDTLAGTQLFLKPECEQHVGAFKYRGARNRLAALSPSEAALGVVAFSSGNHAQGVARAARELDISAVIVMPRDAPSVKVAGVERDGAEIVFYDRYTESRESIAARIAADTGRTLVPSFDDPHIIAGQGTVGLEIARSGIAFDAVITCIGGGGLCAGIALALEAEMPEAKLFGAEPEHYNDTQKSLLAGERQSIDPDAPPSLCDAILTPMPGELTWPINSQRLAGVFAVTDAEALRAVALAHRHLGVVLEPGGAVALAAALRGELNGFGRVCAVLSGGNVDPDVLERALGGEG